MIIKMSCSKCPSKSTFFCSCSGIRYCFNHLEEHLSTSEIHQKRKSHPLDLTRYESQGLFTEFLKRIEKLSSKKTKISSKTQAFISEVKKLEASALARLDNLILLYTGLINQKSNSWLPKQEVERFATTYFEIKEFSLTICEHIIDAFSDDPVTHQELESFGPRLQEEPLKRQVVVKEIPMTRSKSLAIRRQEEISVVKKKSFVIKKQEEMQISAKNRPMLKEINVAEKKKPRETASVQMLEEIQVAAKKKPKEIASVQMLEEIHVSGKKKQKKVEFPPRSEDVQISVKNTPKEIVSVPRSEDIQISAKSAPKEIVSVPRSEEKQKEEPEENKSEEINYSPSLRGKKEYLRAKGIGGILLGESDNRAKEIKISLDKKYAFICKNYEGISQ